MNQLTLGELIEELKKCKLDSELYIDWGGYPGQAISYRGYYEQLAFEYGYQVTVGEFLQICKDANGRTLVGYKGGEYKMNQYTPVWIANSGSLGRKIVGINKTTEGYILITEEG